MESMLKMLSQPTACPQPKFDGFSSFCSPHSHGCVCWAFGALAQRLGALPALSSTHCPVQCSWEPCYFWLLSYVLVWIHTLSLIPSLTCLYCCSSGARVIQFLGNRLLFIPLDAACIAVVQNDFHSCSISLSGCFNKTNFKIILAS